MQLNSDFPNGLTNLAVSPPFRLTSELLVVSRDHHGELPGVRVVQAGEELLLSCQISWLYFLRDYTITLS